MTACEADAKTTSLQREGFCVFSVDQCPFSTEEWSEIQELVLGDPSRFSVVNAGDTNEATRVLVHRLLHDGSPPVAVDPARAATLLTIIGSPARMALYERILGTSPLIIRRAQAHVLTSGGFIGRHIDRESSPHYLAAVILLLERSIQGGSFVIYRTSKPSLELNDFSVLITDAELPHEVLAVTEGQRCTLAFWLARANATDLEGAEAGANC
ncbi:2OG-Fe(II) oxygenase [Bradyrhizobium ottawaense]|uniref:2OG-Fe(II) oxygenase n=1 Tax=Bradyrhizobium ottawaense TaxID=931866 RepID=UPI0038380B1B